MRMFRQRPKPTAGEIEEAKTVPNGSVVRVLPLFEGKERVPSEAIIGAWQVDSRGRIKGDFKDNPNFRPDLYPDS